MDVPWGFIEVLQGVSVGLRTFESVPADFISVSRNFKGL